MEKKLYRDTHNKVIGGVCSGLGEYFDIDITVVRLLFAFAFFVAGVGFIPYIILWIVLPQKMYNPFTMPSDPLTVNYVVPPIVPGQTFSPVPAKKSNAGLIAGLVLIFLGTIFLLNEFDFIPDWDYGKLWPLILVAVGLSIMAAGQQKKPWQAADWHTSPEAGAFKEDAPAAEKPTTENPTTDNTTTV